MFCIGVLLHLSFTVLKVREDQEKTKLEEEQQSQPLPAPQPGQQSSSDTPQPQAVQQPASYVPPQPNHQHSMQMTPQPASQQSLQGANYNAPQSSQLTGMTQGVHFVPHSTGQVAAPVQGQTVSAKQPESEDPETEQQPHHNAGGVYQINLYCPLQDDRMMGFFKWMNVEGYHQINLLLPA